MPDTDSAGQTVLVTGGSGAIARWCIAQLLGRGYAVRTTLRDLSREPEVRASIAAQADPQDRLTFAVADLTGDAGWEAAVQGAQFVLHVASPLPTQNPKDEDELIVPARDGTLRVLRASVAAIPAATASLIGPSPGHRSRPAPPTRSTSCPRATSATTNSSPAT